MNPYVESFRDRLLNRYSNDSVTMTMSEWIEKNTLIKGRPFSFKGYPFQRRIADDMHHNMDVIKPSQVGMSEVQIRKILGWLRRMNSTTAIFTMPNLAMFKRMSQTRVDPIVKESSVFNLEQDQGAVRSMGIIQLGRSFLYLTGCTEGDATSTSADAVFNDEVDLSPQDMLALFNSRLQNSDWKLNQRFSTPTFPGYGIDLSYQSSDQHAYLCKCDSCGHWNDPQFNRDFVYIPGLPDDIRDLSEIHEGLVDQLDILNSVIWCEKCHTPLDLGREDNREWVPKYPNRKHARGYRVSPFSTSRLPVSYVVEQLLKYKKRDFIRGWHNTVLGQAYAGANERLQFSEIKACFTQNSLPLMPSSDDGIFIGIDMGLVCHMVWGKPGHIMSFETVSADQIVSRVKELCERFNVVGGACDRHPYTPTANQIFHVSGGKVWPVEYRGLTEIDIREEEGYCKVNRTDIIDAVVKDVRNNSIQFSGYGTVGESVITDHLRDMVREEEPEKPAVWKKLTGQDHFFHAMAFWKAGHKIHNWVAENGPAVGSMVMIEGVQFGEKEKSMERVLDRFDRSVYNDRLGMYR